ncbi:MAG: hypothetical protein JNL57_06665 [Bacteroidetes bacterium]|nr:hypothetical protein [Bacteroidota bacterium]
MAAISGCYYDNRQELYPNNKPCDTTAISYSKELSGLIQSQCAGCHSAGAPSGGIVLADYTSVKASVSSGRFYGSVNWDAGFSPMPKSGSKWSACNLTRLKKWIDAGAPNN